MINRSIGPLLALFCTGGIIASGVLSLQLRDLSQQVTSLKNTLDQTQAHQRYPAMHNVNTESTAPPSDNPYLTQQWVSLRQEIKALQQELSNTSYRLAATHQSVSANNSSPPPQDYAMQQQQLTQLYQDAINQGYWSHQDAEAFRNQSLNLPPQVIESVSADIIRALEDGRLQMPDDLMIPF